MNSITAVIVIYNKKISDSIMCRCIKKIKPARVQVIVVDNSDIQEIILENKKIAQIDHIEFISMGGNKGLSKAYNVAINVSNGDVIILFDDDTEITDEYFISLYDALEKYPDVDIFAPIVYGQDGVIYSPNTYNFFRNHFINDLNDKISQENFNAISSCLAIRRKIFDDYKFNEMLFVDQVDQLFFYEQRKLKRKFMKLNTVVHQNFYQREKKLSSSAGWKRLRLRIIDIMRYTRLMDSRIYIFLGFIKCCGLGAQIALKSKSVIVFIKAVGLSLKATILAI